jgi:hypothetical protein
MAERIRRLRLRFWLRMMDVARVLWGFGSRPYIWCLERASDATDWGDGADCSGGTGEEPF